MKYTFQDKEGNSFQIEGSLTQVLVVLHELHTEDDDYCFCVMKCDPPESGDCESCEYGDNQFSEQPCDSCRHGKKSDTCNICIDWDEWEGDEPEEEDDRVLCQTCKYFTTATDEYPCCDCRFHKDSADDEGPKWEHK